MASTSMQSLPGGAICEGVDTGSKRSQAFHPDRDPSKQLSNLQLDAHHVRGPLSFLNPTSARFHQSHIPAKHARPSGDPNTFSTKLTPTVSYKWTSRNNRKGRHALAVHLDASETGAGAAAPQSTSSIRRIARGIRRMFTKYPIWDISYDVATIFTLGSVVWIFNAFFVWLPLVRPDTEFKNEALYGGGITAFIGATIFEVGSFLLMAEAVNENKTACFGWALERVFSHITEESVDVTHLRPSKSVCTHHHANKRNLIGKGRVITQEDNDANKADSSTKSWVWFPSITELRTHYIHELGFLASLIQLFAASIFWIAGLTALPGIYDHMSRSITIIFYWNPQVIGGFGFILSGFLFMLETQSKWYKPAFGTLGWWIGAWNMIGGLGFTLCPAFGYDERSWAQYQACLSTFWGSWAFLIGSVVQWYESLEKYPVEVDKSIKEMERINNKGQ